MTGWMDYVSITVAAIGLVQAIFLCLILRSEGARAFGANRWMMIFILAIACNLIEDVIEQFIPVEINGVLNIFFGPINFVIAPSIYLYFREISGNPSRHPWVHAVLPLIVFNLIAWVVTHDGGYGSVLPGGVSVREVVIGFCWTAIFVQISLYIAMLWRVACRYFQQTQEQLGADRDTMRRWIGVILGGLTLVFVTVAIGRIVEMYLPQNTEMFGTEIAFVVVLFAMSYEIATRPALFVMGDWPTDADIEAERAGDNYASSRAPSAAAAPSVSQPPKSEIASVSVAASNDDAKAESNSGVRPLLDEDGVDRAVAQLKDIQKRGDILLDPLVSLPKLARAVGVTPNQLSYVLNHHIGQSFFDFVNSARIAEARAVLLLEPDRTILDIALSVGFNSKSTFNLAFKKITGETPSAVREAARKQDEASETAGNEGGQDASDMASERPDAQHRTPKPAV